MATYYNSSGKSVEIYSELGRGGEGTVYKISGRPNNVAKIYHLSHRTSEKERKISVMISNPPRDDTRKFRPPHASIAWPTEILYEGNQFAGYIMPFIKSSPDIYKVYNPLLRSKYYPNFNRKHLHRTARNLSTALNALHARGCVMGDINQKNILVTQNALVSLVDTDSFQVKDTKGYFYRCPVGVPEYTPPELQGVHMGSVNRKTYHDYFGLAVVIFQLLMEGFHPFTGAPKNPGRSYIDTYLHRIRRGIFPYHSGKGFRPPPSAPSFDGLHPDIQKLFLRCFVDGHKNPARRPTAYEWITALDTAEKALIRCKQNSQHWYSRHMRRCPWCEREATRPLPVQRKLSPAKIRTQATAYRSSGPAVAARSKGTVAVTPAQTKPGLSPIGFLFSTLLAAVYIFLLVSKILEGLVHAMSDIEEITHKSFLEAVIGYSVLLFVIVLALGYLLSGFKSKCLLYLLMILGGTAGMILWSLYGLIIKDISPDTVNNVFAMPILMLGIPPFPLSVYLTRIASNRYPKHSAKVAILLPPVIFLVFFSMLITLPDFGGKTFYW